MYNQTVGREQPFVSAGTGALNQELYGLGIGPNTPGAGGPNIGYGSLSAPFNPANLAQTPGYQFTLGQGTAAVDAGASARGGVNSGNTLEALTQYGQGLASTTYQQQLQDYMAQQQQQFGNLNTLVTGGQNAAGNLGTLGANAAATSSSALLGGANATAAGQVAGANALGGAVNSLGQNFLTANLFGGGDPYGFNASSYGASPGAIADPTNSLFSAAAGGASPFGSGYSGYSPFG